MKKFFTSSLVFAALALLAFVAPPRYFGKRIQETGAVSPAEVVARLQKADTVAIKVAGPVKAVCQKKGCWMTMDMGAGATMQVRFKDYAFFVPKDIAGATVVAEGIAYKEVQSVEELRHYAEDAGKSKEEVAAITQPKTVYSFMAEGVIVK